MVMMSRIPVGTCNAGATLFAWNRVTSAESDSSVSAPNLKLGYEAPGPKFSVTRGARTSWVSAVSISAVTACRDFRKNADWSWDKASDPRPRLARLERPMNPARTLLVCHVSRKDKASLNCDAPLPSDDRISNVFMPGGGRWKPTTPDARMEAMSSALALASRWSWPYTTTFGRLCCSKNWSQRKINLSFVV